MFFLYGGIAWLPEYFSMVLGVDALRRIDPSWLERDKFLFPSIFYLFMDD